MIFVWWIWVWGLPYLILRRYLGDRTLVVHQCHNVTDKEPAWWKSAITNRVLRGSDLAVVHAREEGEEIDERIGDQAPPVMHSFLPVHELGGEIPSREEARERLGITHSTVALFFGHIRPFKGLDLALEAWAQLSAEDALLLVAGEPWWKSAKTYGDLATTLGLGDSVRFDFRFIPDDEVANYFAASDLVVIPYRREAQSGVALTAFHFNRPVVATAIGGLPEVIREGENGTLVAPEDSVALAEGIRRVLDGDAERLRDGAAAAAERYSWQRYTQELLERLRERSADSLAGTG